MIAVIFEVEPAPGQEKTYFDHAALLRPELEQIPGFISVERFRSVTDPTRFLSLSFFKDEVSVRLWRTRAAHRRTQAAGRAGIFATYRLRVAAVTRDYGLNERRDQAPDDSREAHGGPAPSCPLHDAR